MKTEVYKQIEKQHFLGGKGNDRVKLIKSLIYERVGRGTLRGAL